MATKVRILKMLQQMRGLALITQRRPQPKQPGLFLLQMRSHMVQTGLAKRRRTIPIDIQDLPDIPAPVKIRHIPALRMP